MPNSLANNNQAKIQTVMGLDFGAAKMGISLGNTLTRNARPLMQFAMQNGKPDWQALLSLIKQWQATTIVVGLPLNMDGTISPMGLRAKKFARRLKHELQTCHYQCDVVVFDERLSSREAKNLAWEYGLIKTKNDPIDSIASAILLGSWLRSGDGEYLL
ncbi:Holliday junction resolvase YqgF [Moraxella macacae 0408225]|uniref:Putative pre-16S rRNA nuclease n=1 Tax=Moraxella macacae 0408225 TaxID=1230338 RepID=L2F8Z3_9GAMM|nr:Holliday junction resolvase RuvX [Moraxella macacae]ELA09226.1 Holliday junction resolvase YqgF [Moraxella macacae 0408225]